MSTEILIQNEILHQFHSPLIFLYIPFFYNLIICIMAFSYFTFLYLINVENFQSVYLLITLQKPRMWKFIDKYSMIFQINSVQKF